MHQPFVVRQLHLDGTHQHLGLGQDRNVVAIVGDPHVQVIIAFEDDTRVRRALSVAQNIEFYTYSIQFKLGKVSL